MCKNWQKIGKMLAMSVTIVMSMITITAAGGQITENTVKYNAMNRSIEGKYTVPSPPR